MPNGAPTTDPAAGMAGAMLPLGGAKGALLALIVELLVTALTGAAIGSEASSFFVDEGNRPRLGQAFLVIDPDALAGRATYFSRVETLLAEIAPIPARAFRGAPAELARQAQVIGHRDCRTRSPDALAELARR